MTKGESVPAKRGDLTAQLREAFGREAESVHLGVLRRAGNGGG